jgi:hypothetical protein
MSAITPLQHGQDALELAPTDMAVLLEPYQGTSPITNLENTSGTLDLTQLTNMISVGNITKKDGIKLTNNPTINEIKSAGKGSPTRLLASEAVKSVSFVPQEFNKTVLQMYWGAVNASFSVSSTGGITVAIPELPATLKYRALLLGLDTDGNGNPIYIYYVANLAEVGKRTDQALMDSNVLEHGSELVFLTDPSVGNPLILGACGTGWTNVNSSNFTGFYPALTSITLTPTSKTLTVSSTTHTGQLAVVDSNGFTQTNNTTYTSSNTSAVTVAPGGLMTGVGVTGTPTSAVQTATVNGTPTGGTFLLSFNGDTTTPIAYNAATSAVQSALVALSTVGTGNVAVSGSAGGPYTITFQGGLAQTAVPVITTNGAALTGGTSPTVTVANTTPGVAPVVVTATLQGESATCTVTVTP